MSGKVIFTLSSEDNGLNATFRAEIPKGVPWADLLNDVIYPGLRAMGYLVDEGDIS